MQGTGLLILNKKGSRPNNRSLSMRFDFSSCETAPDAIGLALLFARDYGKNSQILGEIQEALYEFLRREHDLDYQGCQNCGE